jgi:hypothetical protein
MDDDVIAGRTVLWRCHRTLGARVVPWNGLRHFGPLPTMRFDPQPPPAGQSEEGVLYAATDIATALAETFQATRVIDSVGFGPHLTAWEPTRPLQLLDLTGAWALRNGASHALASAPRAVCRAWARAVRETWPDLDGLWAPSAMTGKPAVVLFSPAVDSFPTLPSFSRPLAHPAVLAIAAQAAKTTGYTLR